MFGLTLASPRASNYKLAEGNFTNFLHCKLSQLLTQVTLQNTVRIVSMRDGVQRRFGVEVTAFFIDTFPKKRPVDLDETFGRKIT